MERKEIEEKVEEVVSRIGQSNPQIGDYIGHYLFEDDAVTVIVTNGRFKIPLTLMHKTISEEEIVNQVLPSFLDLKEADSN